MLTAPHSRFLTEQKQYWLSYASEQGFSPAKRMLAQVYIEQGDYLAADVLLNDAAEAGDPTAQVLLGHYYIDNLWLKRDLNKAAFWYKRAAEQNDPYGLYFYGKCLENGWGCVKDVGAAFEYYEKARFYGNQLAQKKLKQPG